MRRLRRALKRIERIKTRRGQTYASIAAITMLATVACTEGSQRRGRLRDFLKDRQQDQGTAQVPAGEHNVGYTVITVDAPLRGGGRGPVDVAVWYPTRADEASFVYTYGDNKVRTNLAVDSEPAGGAFPFLLYSHGATGCGLSSAFLTEHLARHGFIVAAPDYTDEHYYARIRQPVRDMRKLEELRIFQWAMELGKERLAQPPSVARREFGYRPEQARAAIDRMVALSRQSGSPFSGHVDESRIGLVGHSFGAWTSMLVGGADAGLWDKRVKAIAALSGPVNDNIYTDSDMRRINVPTLYMYGGEEAKHRNDDKAILYDRSAAPKFLMEVEGADHFTFSGGVKREHAAMSQYLGDRPRATITRYTVLFFEHYLKGEQQALDGLKQEQAGVGRYLMDLGH